MKQGQDNTVKQAQYRKLYSGQFIEANLTFFHAGEVPEAVVAVGISQAVEISRLLPANHFGARRQRSSEQIYTRAVIKGGTLVSLVTSTSAW